LIVDRAADCGKVVGEALQFAGISGHGEITARALVEGFAEVEVPGCALIEEEALKTGPGGVRPPVGALDEAMQIVAGGRHEPQGDVDVDCLPGIIGNSWGGAGGDVIQGLVHGEKGDNDLPPLGVVGPIS
jgi:hypothetical protein